MDGNSTTQPSHVESQCSTWMITSFKYYGVAEECLWSLVSIITVLFNIYSLYHHNKRFQRNTRYSIRLSGLLASNVFLGATIQPYMAYMTRHKAVCSLQLSLLVLGNFSIAIQMLLITLITFDRLRTVRNIGVHNNPNFLQRNIVKNEILLICGLLTIVGVAMVLLALFNQKIGAVLLPLLGVAFAVSNIASLWSILHKISAISKQPGRLELSSSLARFKNTLRVTRMLIASMTITWLPVFLAALIAQAVKSPSITDVFSIARKLLLIRPAIDPLCYQIFQLHRRGNGPTRATVFIMSNTNTIHTRQEDGRT